MLFQICFVFHLVSIVLAFIKCPKECFRVLCIIEELLNSSCAVGTVPGPCGCCKICAKENGQSCGGKMNGYGKCGHGLYCHKSSHDEQGVCRRDVSESEGILPRAGKLDDFSSQSRDQGSHGCLPRCTYEYCSAHPHSTCSAVHNAVLKRSCQQYCQHTHCQACERQRQSQCIACAKDDFECMRKFGKCIRKRTCSRHKYPCKAHSKKNTDGKFVCEVPACL